ncbi:MAG: hypothetical protein M1823_007624, partial [Watsoniomyces obsoletus]
ADLSRAASLKETTPPRKSFDILEAEAHEEDEGVKPHILNSGHQSPDRGHDRSVEEVEGRQDTKAGEYMEIGMAKVAAVVAKWKGKENEEGKE